MKRAVASLTQFQEHLAIISSFGNHIEGALNGFPTSEPNQDDDLKFTLSNHLHILLCSFLEEWEKLEGMGATPMIKETLHIIAPAIKRIRQWRGLSKMRSQILAHPQRDKNGTFTPPWVTFKRFNIPTAYAETILLGNCALVARDTLLRRHSDDWQKASSSLDSLDRHIEDKGIRTIEEAGLELERIKREIVERERGPAK